MISAGTNSVALSVGALKTFTTSSTISGATGLTFSLTVLRFSLQITCTSFTKFIMISTILSIKSLKNVLVASNLSDTNSVMYEKSKEGKENVGNEIDGRLNDGKDISGHEKENSGNLSQAGNENFGNSNENDGRLGKLGRLIVGKVISGHLKLNSGNFNHSGHAKLISGNFIH